MRHTLTAILSVLVIVMSACQLTGNQGVDAPTVPTETEETPQTSPRPTFTAHATAGNDASEPAETNIDSDEQRTQAFAPVVGAGQYTATATVVPSVTPTSVDEDEDGDDNNEEPELLTLRNDLPAMSLREWPRPASDNGWCMHWVRNQYFTEDVLNKNLPRLQQLGAKWVVVVYADENVLQMAAPRFAAAGIVPVWRKMLRPDEQYFDWKRDIELVQSFGLPPYFQLYNEPSLKAEWDDNPDKIDQDLFLDNLMQATQDVYNAGGYVGWQFIDLGWLNDALDELERRGGEQVLERFFFIPHPYGLNHPPSYMEDVNGALGFLFFADVFRQRYGFVPPMIAGEGGWKINNEADARFPKIDDQLHRDYHLEVIRWFQTGTLSNGEPLPDYLFAYCPWLIAEKGDDNAWWDSFAGDRTLTIQAVSNLPPFERTFSWEE